MLHKKRIYILSIKSLIINVDFKLVFRFFLRFWYIIRFQQTFNYGDSNLVI